MDDQRYVKFPGTGSRFHDDVARHGRYAHNVARQWRMHVNYPQRLAPGNYHKAMAAYWQAVADAYVRGE